MKKKKSNVGRVKPLVDVLDKLNLNGFKILVYVYRDRKSLCDCVAEIWRVSDGDDSNYRDICGYTHFTGLINHGNVPKVAILLNRQDIDINTISHECFHVCCIWSEWHKIPPKRRLSWRADGHEDIAAFHGDLVEALIKSLDSHGIRV